MTVKKKAVFLDRDGVINRDPGDYTYNWREFEFNPDLIETLKEFQKKGFLLIIVTNQGGIAKGRYTLGDYQELTKNMLEVFKSKGVTITEVYFSPHHDEVGRSLTRKPDSLLLERAIYKFNIDPAASFMIGDRERDIFAGEKVGIPGILIEANSSLTLIKDRILNG
jgi:D-glycero-D-manno-heptose 1,7-bisphosphate phosphatase